MYWGKCSGSMLGYHTSAGVDGEKTADLFKLTCECFLQLA